MDMTSAKRKIIIVDCISSSVNYINDIIREGYEPVVLNPYAGSDEERENMENLSALYFSAFSVERPTCIFACEKYDDTLAKVKELDPVLILPGGDDGINLASMLSHDLGLPGNNPDNLPKMRNKLLMQKALADAGLRSIRSRIISGLDEAVDFYHQLGDKCVVVKPVTGAATVGVRICSNVEELRGAVIDDLRTFGDSDESSGKVMIQEFIGGTEYIVNSVSCHGKHIVTSTYRYNKRTVPGYGAVYDYCFNVSPDSDEMKAICKYAVNVLDALGITEGATHSEFKVDGDGAVLIEANCRPCGAMMKASWLDSFLGHHETDLVLKALLHSESFLSGTPETIIPGKYAMIWLGILEKDTFVKENRTVDVFGKLGSYVYEINTGNGKVYPRTIDLSTCSGLVYLVNDDLKALMDDYSYMRKVNSENPEMLYKG